MGVGKCKFLVLAKKSIVLGDNSVLFLQHLLISLPDFLEISFQQFDLPEVLEIVLFFELQLGKFFGIDSALLGLSALLAGLHLLHTLLEHIDLILLLLDEVILLLESLAQSGVGDVFDLLEVELQLILLVIGRLPCALFALLTLLSALVGVLI